MRRINPFRKSPLARPLGGPKGSPFRGGNSIVAVGAPTGTTHATTTLRSETYSVSEPAILDRFVVNENLLDFPITDIKISNDSLVTGYVPNFMFRPDSTCSPRFGHLVTPETKIIVTRYNATGGTIGSESAFTARPVPPGDYPQGMYPGRGLVAIGGPIGAALTAATAAQVKTFTITEAGRLGQLCIQASGTFSWDDIHVASIKYDNDELLSGVVPAEMFAYNSQVSPVFGHWVEEGHALTVTFNNKHATETPLVVLGFSCIQ